MASTPYPTTDGVAIAGVTTIPVSLPLAAVTTTADVLTDYVVPFSFSVLGLRAAITTVASTVSKLATFAIYVGPTASAVAVPGASIALTTALATPLGKLILSPATALGVNAPIYPAGTKIQLKATGVTAFIEGAVSFFIELRNCDES